MSKQKLIEILRWPEKKNNRLLPWFIILRRLIFFPFLVFGVCFLYVVLLFMFGWDEANDFWDDLVMCAKP